MISNFTLIEEPPLPMEDVYKANAPLSDREFLMNVAEVKQKSPSERNAMERKTLKAKPELSALRALDKKDAKMAAEKESNDCYEAVTGEGLHMPTDFEGVDQWMGETWDPETKQKSSMSFFHYLNSPEHLERTAVLYSDAGSGKTPASKATARTFAMRYQNSSKPYYLVAGTANGFKTAYMKGLVQKGVPRVIEDFKPMGHPNGKRQCLQQYLIQLLNVKDGGTIDTPGGNTIKFPPETPQIISTNLTFKEWIDEFSKFPIKIQNAISKRIVFFTVPDSPLVKQELRKRKKEDMLSAVEQGLLREREFLKRHCPGAEHLTISTTASTASGPPTEYSSDGQPTGYSSDDEAYEGICWACEEPGKEIRGGLCPECHICPPDAHSEEESSMDVNFQSSPTAVLEDLAAHTHASCVETAFKLYREGSAARNKALEIAQRPEVQAMRECKAFQEHHRCEPNYGLDSGALHLLEKALRRDQLTRMKMSLAKAIVCPRDGMLQQLEEGYYESCGRDLWDESDSTFSPHAMYSALRSMKLDNAYGGMRRNFFNSEAKRQQAQPGSVKISEKEGMKQKSLFANYWAHLLGAGAFEEALNQCAGEDTKIRRILEKTLLVNTMFHRMLVAREFSVLIDTFPRNGGERVVCVGGGAMKIVREFAGKEYVKGFSYKQTELKEDLKKLHDALLQELDLNFIEMICPRGWKLDFTEHACCEKRRYDDAVAAMAAGRKPQRTRNEDGVAQRQELRERRLRLGWLALGFKDQIAKTPLTEEDCSDNDSDTDSSSSDSDTDSSSSDSDTAGSEEN
jgi:hypothetical protein